MLLHKCAMTLKKSTFFAQSFFILPMLKPPATAADHKKIPESFPAMLARISGTKKPVLPGS